MKTYFKRVARRFAKNWQNYLIQSFYATFAIFIVFLVLGMAHTIIVASIASSCFVIFVMPSSPTAQPKNLVGGHIVGLASGSLYTFFAYDAVQPTSFIFYALVVGISIFLMILTDTEHPPAAGTALGVAVQGFSIDVVVAVVMSTIVLSIINLLLRSKLKSLT